MALKQGAGRKVAAAAMLAAAVYVALWAGEYSAFDLPRLERQRAEAERELVAKRARVDSLQKVAQAMTRDTAVERVARERFGMIREGEVLYRFVPVDSGKVAAPAAP